MKHQALLKLFIFHACPLVISISVAFTVLAQSGNPEPPSEEALATLNNAITQIQSEIASRNSQRAAAYQALEKSEQALLSISREITALEARISNNESELARLEIDKNNLLSQKSAQQEMIGQYIRSAYQTGQQEYFKLLLNQEDPVLIARTLRYYQYFNEARNQKVEEYARVIAELNVVENQINQATANLNEQHRALDQQQLALQASFTERQSLLDQLDVLLSSSNKKLEALEIEKAEMEILLDELRRSIANLSLGDQQQPFSSMKGDLPWPVQGGLKNRWGSSYGLGDLDWEGVNINADAGADIIAIHRGRVVYSDWFSSSGLLLIIDHGDGYMSLYAHNQELYKDVGEWVNGGDIIASVGNTGGEQDFGLYFEIRHNGDSENPAAWCVAQN